MNRIDRFYATASAVNASKAPAGDDSHDSLRSSSLAMLVPAVLASSGFVLADCPFESRPAQRPQPHTSPASRFALSERSP
ncbi:hypothetical protein, partial [Halorubrum sp. SD626R]|uniref:hypothetical protein n=1 Tax=Halorubrum sp. SD626R TaxID=1419722 RepID=UPI001C400764